MNLFGSLLVFGIVVGVATALQCYNAYSSSKNYFPTKSEYITCPRASTRCFKMTTDYRSHGSQRSVSFGCDEMSDSFCYGIRDGQCSNEAGVKICCCGSDLCNSGTTAGPLAILALFSAFYLF